MARSKVQSLTSLPTSPLDDRKARIRKYSITMSIRSVCLILLVLIPEWWRYLFGVGAVVLPYIAVVLANVGMTGATDPIRPLSVPLEIEAPREPAPAERPQ